MTLILVVCTIGKPFKRLIVEIMSIPSSSYEKNAYLSLEQSLQSVNFDEFDDVPNINSDISTKETVTLNLETDELQANGAFFEATEVEAILAPDKESPNANKTTDQNLIAEATNSVKPINSPESSVSNTGQEKKPSNVRGKTQLSKKELLNTISKPIIPPIIPNEVLLSPWRTEPKHQNFTNIEAAKNIYHRQKTTDDINHFPSGSSISKDEILHLKRSHSACKAKSTKKTSFEGNYRSGGDSTSDHLNYDYIIPVKNNSIGVTFDRKKSYDVTLAANTHDYCATCLTPSIATTAEGSCASSPGCEKHFPELRASCPQLAAQRKFSLGKSGKNFCVLILSFN